MLGNNNEDESMSDLTLANDASMEVCAKSAPPCKSIPNTLLLSIKPLPTVVKWFRSFKKNGSFKLTTGAGFAALVNNPEHADVVLLVGQSKVRLFAHAAILALKSEFYRCALSEKWKRDDAFELVDGKKRVIIHHPEIAEQDMLLILEFIYTGCMVVTRDFNVFFLVMASHRLLLHDLSTKCLEDFEKNALGPVNAFMYYWLCDYLNMEESSAQALHAIASSVPTAIHCGIGPLSDLSLQAVASLLEFPLFTAVEKWHIMITWIVVSKSQAKEVDVKKPIPVGVDLEVASISVSQLIGRIGIFTLNVNDVKELICPHSQLLPLVIRQQICYQYNLPDLIPRKPCLWVGKAATRPYRGKSISRVIPSDFEFVKLIDAIAKQTSDCEYFDVECTYSFNSLLFDSSCDLITDIRKKCKRVVLLFKDENYIVGAYNSAYGQTATVIDAFLFKATWSATWNLEVHRIRDDRKISAIAVDKKNSLTFGMGDLTLDLKQRVATSALGRSYGNVEVDENALLSRPVSITDFEIFSLIRLTE